MVDTAAPANSSEECSGNSTTELLDRHAILDCVHRYCRGIDRHDTALVASAFHPDAVADFGAVIGPVSQFIEYVNPMHGAKWAAHQHYVLNHRCELDGSRAHAETYWLVAGRCHDAALELNGGRYVDSFEKRAQRWAIAQRVCVYEWGSDPAQVSQYLAAFLPGIRGTEDPSYQRPPALRPFVGLLASAHRT